MSFRSNRSLWVRIAVLAGIASAYIVAGKLGLMLAVLHRSATPVWPPSGISIAVLLLLGFDVWPAIFVGAFVTNYTTEGSVLTCFGIAAGNCLEALVGAWLVRRFAGGRDAFLHPHNVFKFAALAGGLSTMIAATFGVGSLMLTGYTEGAHPGAIWLTWWLGDAMGDLLLAPVILLWASDPLIRMERRNALEAALMVLLLIGLGMAAFGRFSPLREANYPLGFLFIPFLMWPSFRFQPRASATASLIFSAFTIFGTMRGFGPFARVNPNAALLLLQAYAGVTAITALSVTAAVWQRRQAEQRLRDSEQRLARTNADLERFAFATSHDLQEPLRGVTLFAQLIDRRYRGKLGVETDEWIDRVLDGAERMNGLIEGLRTYARIAGTDHVDLAPVPLGEAVEWALSNLEVLIVESGAHIAHQGLPVVRGDREQLGRLFQNLIANSIRYRSEAPPQVRIEAERGQDEWLISVHDNGRGIDPRYRKVIFELFRRLHGSHESGSGIGLSIAKRIVELHGGRIWVDAPHGTGSIFRFTIPC